MSETQVLPRAKGSRLYESPTEKAVATKPRPPKAAEAEVPSTMRVQVGVRHAVEAVRVYPKIRLLVKRDQCLSQGNVVARQLMRECQPVCTGEKETLLCEQRETVLTANLVTSRDVHSDGVVNFPRLELMAWVRKVGAGQTSIIVTGPRLSFRRERVELDPRIVVLWDRNSGYRDCGTEYRWVEKL